MKSTKQDSQFAWKTLCVFFALGIWVFFLEIAGKTGLVEKVTERLLRLVPGVLCFLYLIWLTRRSRLSRSIVTTFIVVAVCMSGDMLLEYTNYVAAVADVPLIGHNSTLRPIIERMFSGVWFGAGFLLIFLMVKSLESTSQQLETALDELQASQEQNIRRERLSALGQMASGVAHDLNNTLAPVVAYTESLLSESTLTAEQRRRCECALQAATDAATVVKRLGQFYRGQDTVDDHEEIQLSELLSQIPLLTRPKWRDEAQLKGCAINMQLDLHEVPPVLGSAAELRTVFTKLVFNAVDALPDGGTITLRSFERDGSAVVEVVDTGVGMTEEQAAHCFEPFFSTKAERSGLGLSVCHGIIAQHGGRIEAEAHRPRGMVFRVMLPVAASRPAAADETDSPAPLPTSLHCLYIEDDDAVRDAFATMFQVIGAQLDLAADGAAGLELVRTNNYDIVFTDLGMTGTDGARVLRAVKRARPQLPVVVISGWPRDEIQQWFPGPEQPDRIIEKPAKLNDVQQVLQSLAPITQVGSATNI